jgi:exodeoxyribonuclease V gamma subunit
MKGTDLVELWIQHLLLNLLAPPGVELRSMHAARDASRGASSVVIHTLKPVNEPELYLQELLDHYWQGLRAPLHFFPETSRAWAEATGSGREREKARAVWEKGFATSGEGTDPAYRIIFRETDPLDEQFIALTRLFTPIFAHLEAEHAAA